MTRSRETERVVNQFNTADQAARYSSEFNTHRQQRSRRCIEATLAGIPAGSRILDVPCGTGRLIPLLMDRGLHYTGLDASEHMVGAARKKLQEQQARHPDLAAAAELAVEDIMHLPFEEGTFDAVIVNRLFHHYTQAETRIAALRELNRVASGPIIVFFLNTWTVRGLLFHFKHRNDPVMERSPISLSEFRANGRAAGLTLTRTHATRGRFNKEWYATFERI